MENETVHEFIRRQIKNYRSPENGGIDLAEGLEWSQYAEVKTIEYLTNYKFEYGSSEDEDGVPRAFYDVIERLLDNTITATDIDTKDANIQTDNDKYYWLAFLFSKFNKVWMREAKIAGVFNETNRVRHKYGGVLIKKSEVDGELFIDVIPWGSSVTDPTDIANGVKIIEHDITPAEVMEHKEWDEDAKKNAIRGAESNKDKTDDGSDVERDTIGDFVKVYELHGVLPMTIYKQARQELGDEVEIEEDDQYDYKLMQIITSGNPGEKGDGEVTTLYAELQDENLFKYLPAKKVDGRSLGRGVVERSKHGQWWTNHAIQAEKKAMDFAGKVFLQTPTSNKEAKKHNFKKMPSGKVLTYTPGNPYNVLQMAPAALNKFKGLVDEWNVQLERANSTYAINTGESQPSNTPYRLGAILNQEANSPFNQQREDASIFWEEVWRDWVIPYLRKQITNVEKLEAELTLEEIKEIDEQFSNWKAEKIVMEGVLNGKFGTPTNWDLVQIEYDALRNGTLKALRKFGNRRYFQLSDAEWEEIELRFTLSMSNEQQQKMVYLETLSNILTTVSNSFDPQSGKFTILESPVLSKLFNEIMETAGYSSVELEAARNSLQGQELPTPQPAQQEVEFEVPEEQPTL